MIPTARESQLTNLLRAKGRASAPALAQLSGINTRDVYKYLRRMPWVVTTQKEGTATKTRAVWEVDEAVFAKTTGEPMRYRSVWRAVKPWPKGVSA